MRYKSNTKMKNLLLLLLLLCSLSLFSQTTPIDTSYTVQDANGQYFKVKNTILANGEQYLQKTLIGDSVSLTQQYRSTLFESVRSAREVALNLNEKTRIKNLIQIVTESDAATNGRFSKKLGADYNPEFVSGTWAIGTDVLVFTVKTGGTLSVSVNGGASKVVDVWGDIIRIRNYPSAGTHTVFYRKTPRVFVDAALTYKLINTR